MKVALITGITGQDGHHLTPFLKQKGYEVHGLISGQERTKSAQFADMYPYAKLHFGDLTDFSSLLEAVSKVKPDEIYNLGAISFVGLSFNQPELTANVTGLGTLRLLESVRKLGLAQNVKIFQASSSEMFGKVQTSPQSESTPFYPRSPYAVAKTFAHYSCVNYREAYGMFISCGIMFNHEGEHRGFEFVTRKITSNLVKIKLGLIDNFELGDLSPKRDWGYAGDYAEAMWKILQHEIPTDFVIATGQTRSVKEFLDRTLRYLELDDDVSKYVKFNEIYLRPTEVDLLVGDSTKAKSLLNWYPKTSFDEMIKIMVENDLQFFSK
jgi:GDPmannose 4,6-dehydratase